MRLFIKFKNRLDGFSLLEMVISMSIISIMSITLYGSYPSMNKFVSYATAINDFASQIKEIQIYGASRGGDNSKGDGIYMATGTPYNYYLFNDAINSSSTTTGIGTSNLRWDGASLEPTTTKSFLNSTYITRLCYNNSFTYTTGVAVESGTYTCNIPNIMLTFSRPKLNANIAYVPSGGATTTADRICLEMGQVGVSTSTQQRSIVVKSSGQIIVQKTRCTP